MTDRLSHYFKRKLNPGEHFFFQSKSVTSLVSYLDYISPLEWSQHQDAVYFDLCGAPDLVLHTLVLQNLSDCGFSDDHIRCLRSYLLFLILSSESITFIRYFLKCCMVLLKDPFLVPYSYRTLCNWLLQSDIDSTRFWCDMAWYIFVYWDWVTTPWQR